MTLSQRQWLDRYGQRYVIEVARSGRATTIPAQAPLDLRTVFGRDRELVVEIGGGHGETLTAAALDQPDRNYLGFEVFEAGLAATVGKLAEAGLDNVRLIAGDGVDGLRHLLTAASCQEIWVFFPDPWHKTRHHKRRLVSPGFADLVASRLKPGGYLRLATDWPDYADWMTTVLDSHPALRRQADGRFPTRPITKYEARGLAQGRVITDLTYQRVSP
jgi:tRNA (guanine-N7-)-methyltransferase